MIFYCMIRNPQLSVPDPPALLGKVRLVIIPIKFFDSK